MTRATLLTAICCLLLCEAPAMAVDLTKIERRIEKEPKYTNKPRYCLLVFGPEAKTRVWLVRDGKTLYVDNNGNSDLTEKGEKLELRTDPDREGFVECDVGDIVERDGKTKHLKLRVGSWDSDDHWYVSVEMAFAHLKVARLSASAAPTFAARTADAPIVHFGGPLALQVSISADADDQPGVRVRVGTPGLGKWTFADCSILVAKLVRSRPEITIDYPDNKGGTIRETSKLYFDL
jgi:hypothetical protein